MTYLKPGLLLCTLLLWTVPAQAQSYSDTFASLKELGFDPTYLVAAAGLGVLLIAFYLFAIIFRKIQKNKRPDMMTGISYIDVSGLGKSGLLTPEEQAKVRQAMSRQLTRQQQASTRPNLPGELSLLADPEVQRLEELAKAKQRGEVPTMTSPPLKQTPIEPAPAPQPKAPVDAPAPKPDIPAFIDPIPADWGTKDDVQLPPDVLSLVENGLITPEELEVIKARMRAKK